MKKRLTLLTILIGLGLFSIGQTNIDSLWRVWNDRNQPDTTRLKAMHSISWYGYLFSQPDSAFYFAQVQYDYAKSRGQKKHMSSALHTQGTSFYFQSDYVKAIDYFTRSIKIMEEIGYKKGIAASLNNIGLIYKKQGDYKRAIDCYTRSSSIYDEIGNKEGISGSLHNIGNIYSDQGDYARAIDYYIRSLTIKEKIKNKTGIANTLNSIGSIYKDQGDYESALEYYTRSLSICEEIQFKNGIGSSLHNIGNIYKDQGDYAGALDYYFRNLTIREETKNKSGIANALSSIGIIYGNQKDFPRALDYQIRSLSIYEEIDDKDGIASSLIEIGIIYRDKGDYTRTISYLNRALITAQEARYASEIRKAAKALYNAYKSIGRNKQALEMYEFYIATRDSIDSEKNQKEVIRQKYKYDYDKKAIADSVTYVQVQKVQEAKLEKSRILQSSLLGGVVLLVAFLIYVFNRFRVTRKQKLLISEQNEELTIATEKAESANSELKTKSKELEKFNAVMLDREMRIIELKKEINNKAKSNKMDVPYPEVEDD